MFQRLFANSLIHTNYGYRCSEPYLSDAVQRELPDAGRRELPTAD